MRHNLQAAYERTQLGPETEHAAKWHEVLIWLEDSGLNPMNIPMRGAYVVRAHAEGGQWYLVARRYIKDTRGQRIKSRITGEPQTTLAIAAPVKTPPSFLLTQENPA